MRPSAKSRTYSLKQAVMKLIKIIKQIGYKTGGKSLGAAIQVPAAYSSPLAAGFSAFDGLGAPLPAAFEGKAGLFSSEPASAEGLDF